MSSLGLKSDGAEVDPPFNAVAAADIEDGHQHGDIDDVEDGADFFPEVEFDEAEEKEDDEAEGTVDHLLPDFVGSGGVGVASDGGETDAV